MKENEVHLRAKLLVLLFSIDLISFQRNTIGTHTATRLQAQKQQSASQFSCGGKNGMFVGDLHPWPDVCIPIIERLSHFQMASPNPQGIFRLLEDDFNLRVRRQAGSLCSLLSCSPSYKTFPADGVIEEMGISALQQPLFIHCTIFQAANISLGKC